jgi:hypothetical protein
MEESASFIDASLITSHEAIADPRGATRHAGRTVMQAPQRAPLRMPRWRPRPGPSTGTQRLDSTAGSPEYLAALEQVIADAGVVITRLADLGGAHGYSQPGRITILESLALADTAAVLVHEFAHELLHQRGDARPASKTVRETEAEAVAFIVGTAIGIRSSVDATDYVGAALMWRCADSRRDSCRHCSPDVT